METLYAYWPFVRGMVDSPHKGQWRGALMCAWTNGWANNGGPDDLRRHGAHYDITVMPGYFFRVIAQLLAWCRCWHQHDWQSHNSYQHKKTSRRMLNKNGPNDRSVCYTAIYRGAITKLTHYFHSLAPVFKVTNYHVTGIIRQTIRTEFNK